MLYISRGYLDLTILALLLISIASALLKIYMPLPRPLLTRFARLYHVHFAVTGTTISELGSHRHLTILALISIASALLKTYTPLPRPLLTRFVRLYHVHFAVTGTTISELGSVHLTILALLLISVASAFLKTYTPLPRPFLTRFTRLYHVHSALTGTTVSELGSYHLTILALLLISLASALLNTYTPLPRPYH